MRITGLFLTLGAAAVCLAQAPERQNVRVVVDSAEVRAEASGDSYLIDRVPRNMILRLLQPGKIREEWFYVKFTSPRYGAPATGFILADMVEPVVKQVIPGTKTAEPVSADVRSGEKTHLGSTPMPMARPPFPYPVVTGLKPRSWPPPLPRTEVGSSPLPSPRRLNPVLSIPALEPRIWKPASRTASRPSAPPREAAPPPPPAAGTARPDPEIIMRRSGTALEFDLDFGDFRSFRHFTMTGPDRIVIDMTEPDNAARTRRIPIPHPDIDAIRIGRFQENVTRAVFDFARPRPAYRIEKNEGGLRVILYYPNMGERPTESSPLKILVGPTALEAARPPLPPPPGRFEERGFIDLRQPAPPVSPARLAVTALPSATGPVIPPPSPVPQETAWPVTPIPAAQDPPAIQPPPPLRPPRPRIPGNLSLGIGYGASPGGMGVFIQANHGSGLALHAGIGVYPTSLIYSDSDWAENRLLFSFGLKYYLPLRFRAFFPFLDIQVGGLRVEAIRLITRIWDFAYEYSNQQKTLYGPSLLAGWELRIGRVALNAAGGISYSLTAWEWQSGRIQPVLDLGLVFHF